MKAFVYTFCPLVVIAALLILYDISAKYVDITCKNPYIEFAGGSDLFHREVFWQSRVTLRFMSPAEQGKTKLHYRGKAYPLPTLTTSTLTSLGFSYSPIGMPGIADSMCTVHLGAYEISVSFLDGHPDDLNVVCDFKKGPTSPCAISYDGKPMFQLPASRADIVKSFGSVYYVDSVIEKHPVRHVLLSLPHP